MRRLNRILTGGLVLISSVSLAEPAPEQMLIARTTLAEAGFRHTETRTYRRKSEYLLIISSIHFRSKASQKTATEVITSSNQYSWLNNKKLVEQYSRLSKNDRSIQEVLKLLDKYPDYGSLPQEMKVVTGYYNHRIVNPYKDLKVPWNRDEITSLDLGFYHSAVAQHDWIRRMIKTLEKEEKNEL